MDESPGELVRRSQRGDREAFCTLIDRHERACLAIAYAVLGDAEDAGDAVQDGCLRAWQRIGELRDTERFAAWLGNIVRNAAIDRRRSRERRPTMRLVDDGMPTPGGDPSGEAEAAERRQRIDEAMRSLDELSREIVALRYYGGMDSRAIAEMVDLTPAAVDMRLSRARAKLKEILGEVLAP